MIEIKQLVMGYGSRMLLSQADVRLPEGRLVALVGRNGSGKSTLLRIMAGLLRPLEGSVVYNGRPVAGMSSLERSRTVSFVSTEKVRAGGLVCRDLVALGRAPYTDWSGRLREKDRAVVDQAIELVGLHWLADRPLDKMSDGECQKAMVARAVAQDTPVILLDEPTAFLDYPNRRELSILLKMLSHGDAYCTQKQEHPQKQEHLSQYGSPCTFSRKTIVYSTHDIDLALEYCDDLLALSPPFLYYGASSDTVIRDKMWKAFE